LSTPFEVILVRFVSEKTIGVARRERKWVRYAHEPEILLPLFIEKTPLSEVLVVKHVN
jgi:hypothetical protein